MALCAGLAHARAGRLGRGRPRPRRRAERPRHRPTRRRPPRCGPDSEVASRGCAIGKPDLGVMRVHPLVEQVVDTYLGLVDAEVAGLVEGLYLEGSAVLGDFHPATSDIDFVAVTTAQPDRAMLAALERVHTYLWARWRRPFFDGIYLTWNDLARGPAHAGPVPYAHEGRFHAETNGEHNPVTWHTLARHGRACRGPVPARTDIWAVPEDLARWTDHNLDSYWRPWLQWATPLWTRFGRFALTSPATVWAVTGVSRLHYTLATGDITSKEGAGRYALQAFPPAWHRIVNEALRVRRREATRSLYRTPLSRRQDLLAFGDMVITDAHRIYADRPR